MNKEEFNSFQWHDVILENITIHKHSEGINDCIVFIISYESIIRTVTFENVYQATLLLNFGVSTSDTIFDADIIDDTDSELLLLKNKWEIYYKDIDNIIGFKFTMSSTSSVIKIFAMSISINESC